MIFRNEIVFRPSATQVSKNDQFSKPFPQADPSCGDCIEWCAQYKIKPEKVSNIDPSNGYMIRNQQLIASRLCKAALFKIFKRALDKRRLGTEATEITYKNSKRHSRTYQKVNLHNV